MGSVDGERDILPTIVDLWWNNFPFFIIYIYPAGRQAHQDVHMYNIIHTLLASKAVGRIATGGSFLTSSGWNQNMPSAGLPHGMCVRAQCYGGTKLAHCESITAKFVMQFFASSIYQRCRVKHSYQEMPYSSYLVNFCIIAILVYGDLV